MQTIENWEDETKGLCTGNKSTGTNATLSDSERNQAILVDTASAGSPSWEVHVYFYNVLGVHEEMLRSHQEHC